MIGLLIGDLATTRSPLPKLKKKHYGLINDGSHITKIGYMSIALGQAILTSHDDLTKLPIVFENVLDSKKYHHIRDWRKTESIAHVAVCGMIKDVDLETVKACAKAVIRLTHQDLETQQAAEALAAVVYLAKRAKLTLLNDIKQNYFRLDFNLAMIRKRTLGTLKPIDAIAYATEAFLEGTSFTDSLHLAMSLQSRLPDILIMTSAIAANHSSVAIELKNSVYQVLEEGLLTVVKQFDALYPTHTQSKRYRSADRVYGQLPLVHHPFFKLKDHLKSMQSQLDFLWQAAASYQAHKTPSETFDKKTPSRFKRFSYESYKKLLRHVEKTLHIMIFDLCDWKTFDMCRRTFNNLDSSSRLETIRQKLHQEADHELPLSEVQFYMIFTYKFMNWNSGFLIHLQDDVNDLTFYHLYRYLLNVYTDAYLYETITKRKSLHKVQVHSLMDYRLIR